MGMIEDTRKVLQDVIAPDLKAINARLDGLERTINARFDGVSARLDSMAAVAAANHAVILNALDLEKRLSRLESQRQPEVSQQ